MWPPWAEEALRTARNLRFQSPFCGVPRTDATNHSQKQWVLKTTVSQVILKTSRSFSTNRQCNIVLSILIYFPHTWYRFTETQRGLLQGANTAFVLVSGWVTNRINDHTSPLYNYNSHYFTCMRMYRLYCEVQITWELTPSIVEFNFKIGPSRKARIAF